jgi:methyl coenzyme M reductase subunit C-like uncharacterized protein (methanogenesis marker protein 7)
MTRKTIRKNKKKQIGGWNETTLNNFKEEVIKVNDRLKQTDRWWDELKEELEYYADEMSDEFMAESRFQGMPMGQVQDSLDLINILCIELSYRYARMILMLEGGLINNNDVIETLNKRTFRLKDIVNIDFVEFIQVLIEFVKSSKHYGELNEIKYKDPERLNDREELIEEGNWITARNGPQQLSRRIVSIFNSSMQASHYGLYNSGLMDCVKLLEIFLLKAYTGEYGELQARDIICRDYFFDSINNRDELIEKVESIKAIDDKIKELNDKYEEIYDEYDEYTETTDFQDLPETDPIIVKLRQYQKELENIQEEVEGYERDKNKLNYDLLDGTDETEFIEKQQIRELWKELYSPSIINSLKYDKLKQADRDRWKISLKKWKQSFKLMLVSMLVHRNNYKFFEKMTYINFDKSISKTYEQFQVKLAVFYKKLLLRWTGFETLEEYHKANTDMYKNKNKLDFRFIDILNCIEEQLEILKIFMHPRNDAGLSDETESDDSDSDSDSDFEPSVLPSTRHVHLYDEKLGIDLDEDSDDEFERIGKEYTDHIEKRKGHWNLEDITDALRSIKTEFSKYSQEVKSIPLNLLKNIGRQVDIKQTSGEDILTNLILEVFKKEKEKDLVNNPFIIKTDVNEIIENPEYIYRIAIGGLIESEVIEDPEDDNEELYRYDKNDSLRGYSGYLEVVDFSVNDPSLHNLIYKQIYKVEQEGNMEQYHTYGDVVYFSSFADYQKPGDRSRKILIIHSGDVIGFQEDWGFDNKVQIEYTDSELTEVLDVQNVNLFRLGCLANIYYNIQNKFYEHEEKEEYLLETFKKFKNLNDIGESTYHLEYSKGRRGNPNLYAILEERGLEGQEYMEDLFNKMTAYTPDKKINMKELRNLRGTGLDLPKHKKNIWPERIGYLEAIIEDDKEFVSENPEPKRKWEMEPDGWDSEDEAGEEEFSKEGKEKKMEEYLNKKRIGISRSLQRDWYKKLGVQNMISSKKNEEEEDYKRIVNIPKNLLEDNPVFNQERVKRRLQKSLKNKYGLQSRSNLPSIQSGIRGQLRNQKYTMRRNRGREIALQADRMRDMRERRSRMDANILDEELLRQSRLIDGRTPVQVMNLDEHLRPFQHRSFAETDNLRRNIDRRRDSMERRMRRDREEFNRSIQ